MGDLTYPYNITNGSVPDADKLMANLNAIKTLIEALEVDNFSEAAQGALVPTGAIFQTAAAAAPTGYLLCDGGAVSRSTYDDLFDAIGTTYGSGNGSTTFNVPNLKGRVPMGRDSSAPFWANLGQTGGAAAVTLTEDQLPSHNHSDGSLAGASHSHEAGTLKTGAHFHVVKTTTGNLRVSGGNFPVGSTTQDILFGVQYTTAGVDPVPITTDSEDEIDVSGTTNSSSVAVNGSTGSAGGGDDHSNLQPYLVLNAIIKI